MQMKGLLKELGGSFEQLLSQKRAGVVAALVAACLRTGACQEVVCAALTAALHSRQQEDKVQLDNVFKMQIASLSGSNLHQPPY